MLGLSKNSCYSRRHPCVQRYNCYKAKYVLTRTSAVFAVLFHQSVCFTPQKAFKKLRISVRLDVVITPGNGYFEILDGEQLAASGYIRIPEEKEPFYYANFEDIQTSEIAERIELDTEDAYKEFLLRGYEYGQAFR